MSVVPILSVARYVEPATRVAGRNRSPQLFEPRLQEAICDDERLESFPGVAPTGRNRLVGGVLQVEPGRSGWNGLGHQRMFSFCSKESRLPATSAGRLREWPQFAVDACRRVGT